MKKFQVSSWDSTSFVFEGQSCVPIWHAEQLLFFEKLILGSPDTKLYLLRLAIVLKFKWFNILCHNQFLLELTAIKHVGSNDFSTNQYILRVTSLISYHHCLTIWILNSTHLLVKFYNISTITQLIYTDQIAT